MSTQQAKQVGTPQTGTPATRSANGATFRTGARRESRPPAMGLPEDELFFTKPEVAKLLKVSLRTVTEMMGRGEIPYLKFGKRLVRFGLEDVQRRLNETCLYVAGVRSGLQDHGQRAEITGQRSGSTPHPPSLSPIEAERDARKATRL